jgi:hypothetical protein
LNDTSAWAVIHYFASRKGKAANAASDAVLTWPEGNFWLVKQLRQNLERNIRTDALAYDVIENAGGVEILYFDNKSQTSHKIKARTLIMATPQFVSQRLLKADRKLDYNAFQYAPWMVANITTTAGLVERKGEPLSWDNVFYGSQSLGYVNALNQRVGMSGPEKIITYYQPLLGADPVTLRTRAYKTTAAEWSAAILSDLTKPHPEIEKAIQDINVWVWGHGMIKPTAGFIWGEHRSRAGNPVTDRIFFAHSDLSGISIFEEAFYQGHKAARAVLKIV